MKARRDAHGTIVELMYAFLNEAAARLYGKSVDEVLGHGQCELFPSVKELGIWDLYLEVIESGSPVSFDVPWFQENGVEGSFRLTATHFGDGLLISASDTTEKVALERTADYERAVAIATMDSLIEPRTRFEAVRDETGQIINFVCEDANLAACRYYKMTYRELIGMRLPDLPTGPIGTDLMDRFRHVIETAEPLVIGNYLCRPDNADGEERHFEIQATLVVVNRMTCTWRDLTDMYVAAETAQRTATVVEFSAEAMMSTTLEGVVTSWNPASERLYGYSSGEIMGKPSRSMVPDDLVEDQRAMLGEVKAGRTLKDLETWRVRKDGTKFPASLTMSPILDADGAVVGVSAITRDLTEQPKAIEVAQRLAAIVENPEDALIGKTLDGIITTGHPGT